ncbi:MAG: hypothetical protein K1Y36_15690 [Blastocatellia bacterium]|nr:hypothetical protein [Blastocatellia bacterium]
MSDLSVIARIPKKDILVGGEQHSGWLPVGASMPMPEPIRTVSFSFEIQFDGSGFLLCYQSFDGKLYGDTWHETLREAQQAACEEFGIQSNEWQTE